MYGARSNDLEKYLNKHLKINDALLKALTNIDISFKRTINSANVILLRNDLTSIIELVIINKETLKKIYQNLF